MQEYPKDKARKMLIPLFLNTTQNICATGTEEALTGPVSRGDTEILKKHITALENLDDNYKTLYRNLAHTALLISIERGDISEDKAAEIRELLES